MSTHRPLPRDRNGYPITGGAGLYVLEVSIGSGSWAEVAVPSGIDCKRVIMEARDGADFQVSHLAAGSAYITLSRLDVEVSRLEGQTIAYVKGTTSTTLEVLIIY